MKKVIVTAAVVFMTIFTVSCMETFSSSLRSEFTQNNIEISEVQFFNSEKIELEREVKQKEAKVSKGSYVKEKKSVTETVVFHSGTPGGYVGEQGDLIKISFDENDDNKFLVFKLNGSKYVLNSVNGKITYNGNEYKVINGGDAYLSIDMDVSKIERDNEVEVKGRRVVKKVKSADDVQ